MTFTDWDKGIALTRHSCSLYCAPLSSPQNLPAVISRARLLLFQRWRWHLSAGNPTVPQVEICRFRRRGSRRLGVRVTEQADCVAQLPAAPKGDSPGNSRFINVIRCFSSTHLFGKKTRRDNYTRSSRSEFGFFWVSSVNLSWKL